MAQHTETVDDLTGAPDAQPVRFSFDGIDYEIDLTEHNRRRLRNAFTPYINAVRRRDYRTTRLPPNTRR